METGEESVIRKAFAAIVYVTEIEHDTVMKMFDWSEFTVNGDEQKYYSATIHRGEKELAVVAAQQDEMGMCAAAVLSTKIINHFQPTYLIMPGIAAGTSSIKGGEVYGDVLVADTVWNYSNGKYVDAGKAEITYGTIGFIPRPVHIEMDKKLVEILKTAITNPNNECHVHLGVLASGSTVVANRKLVDMQVISQFNNTLGLEMEAYGVAYAANHAVEPKPYAIIAKSVCDYADNRKNDDFQKFAAHTSCEFVQFLCEEILPENL